ncbi:MAG: hypothetical protein AMXMBFR64_52240 [Myxococcales bacterium]
MQLDLFGIFGAGLLTYLTPCVLPVIPIYLSALLGGDLRNASALGRGQLVGRALLFALGFLLVFTALGLGASSLGAALVEHKAAVQAFGAALILVFALKFLGLVRIPLLDRVVRGDDRRMSTRFTGVNAVLMGVVFAAGWSPCVGPVLGTVLTYTASNTSDPLTGAGWLFTYGLGFALPLVVTAAFAEAGVRALRRVQPWLPRIERGIGVALLVVAGSMVWDLAPALRADEPVMLASARPAVLELHSSNCPICKRMQPLVDRIEERCDGGIDFVKKDVSLAENRALVSQHRVVGVPTYVFLDARGDEVARLVGQQTESALLQAVSVARGEQCPGVGPVPEGPLALPEAPVACGLGPGVVEEGGACGDP